MDCVFIGAPSCALYRFGVSPNKLLDYMMAGRPVIQAIEAGNDMVAECRCGISTKSGDAASVASAVRRMMQLTETERAEMGARAHAYVKLNHQYSHLAARCLKIISAQNAPISTIQTIHERREAGNG